MEFPPTVSPNLKRIINHIHSLISRDNNFVCLFVGDTGSGKSSAALSFAQLVDPSFSLERFAFSKHDYYSIIHEKKATPGQAIVFDEAGVEINRLETMSKDSVSMSKLFQTMRQYNHITILTAPKKNYIMGDVRDQFDMIFEMGSKARYVGGGKFIEYYGRDLLPTTFTVAVPLKTYETKGKGGGTKWLRRGDLSIMKSVYFPSPDLVTWQEYRRMKNEYADRLVSAEYQIVQERSAFGGLTDKQKEVYELAKKGLTQVEIAKEVSSDQAYVSRCIKSIKRKGFKV